ncbi:MAG TPA: J domain-containing protein [Terracidiphilus sp.]|nr:J domain-containing protein [Terracidiphilus sp.]
MKNLDYYGLLQISPHADQETIHRVYRFLAGRFHPDNPESGDPEMFLLVKKAYDVLSDPARRSEYDAACETEPPEAAPFSTSIDFMDSMEGESNRRLAVLALLYNQRRTKPLAPEVPLNEVEERMGFPRDYLDFTTWYLQKKGYISRADNSDFSLTADGVDFVETKRATLPVLNKMLTGGTKPTSENLRAANETTTSSRTPDTEPPTAARTTDRRTGRDRRGGAHDTRAAKTERRTID